MNVLTAADVLRIHRRGGSFPQVILVPCENTFSSSSSSSFLTQTDSVQRIAKKSKLQRRGTNTSFKATFRPSVMTETSGDRSSSGPSFRLKSACRRQKPGGPLRPPDFLQPLSSPGKLEIFSLELSASRSQEQSRPSM